jgi:hypothetical protein
MFDLTHFSLRDMTECGARLRKCGDGAGGMAEAADRIVRYLFENLGDPATHEQACVLVRFFKTCDYGGLPEHLRRFADGMLSCQPVSATMKCLTLLSTAGIKPEWNRVASSTGHQAIPLVSEQLVAQAPMIANLITQFGLDIRTVLHPHPEMFTDLTPHNFNVFHVPEALDCSYVPAQKEFVVPFGVRSVLGFGGLLPPMSLFAVILFSRVGIPRATAELFRTLSLCVRVAVLPFAGDDNVAT